MRDGSSKKLFNSSTIQIHFSQFWKEESKELETEFLDEECEHSYWTGWPKELETELLDEAANRIIGWTSHWSWQQRERADEGRILGQLRF